MSTLYSLLIIHHENNSSYPPGEVGCFQAPSTQVKEILHQEGQAQEKGLQSGSFFFYHQVLGITDYRNRRTGPSTLPTISQSQAPVFPSNIPKDMKNDSIQQLIHKVFLIYFIYGRYTFNRKIL